MNQSTDFILKPRDKIHLVHCNYELFSQEIYHFTQRLFIQIQRRPSNLISGIIQPLLWLILFGGLFQNAPIRLFTQDNTYGSFLSCGIIIFTSFTGSLNAGLPLIFDREFGFLNRLLVSPLISRDTLLLSSSCFMVCITIIQTIIVIFCSLQIFHYSINITHIYIFILITCLIASSISNISLILAFLLPGHIEFLALTLLINLPMLFSSTALAPLSFMPYWLQIITTFNPLTYAIESIRFILTVPKWSFTSIVVENLWFHLSLSQSITILTLMSLLSFWFIKLIVSNKIE